MDETRRWTPEDFPVGFHDIHPDRGINFQLNRLYTWSGDAALLAQLREASPGIGGYADLIRILGRLGEEALDEGEILRAALCLRGAEFFMTGEDPRKQDYRRRFIALSNRYYGVDAAQHHLIPYESGFLSAYRFTPARPRATLLIIGGFDGYVEELTRMALVFRDAGYDVIAFDGPGQGTALEDSGLVMTPDWERPTSAVLDHFGVSDAVAVGMSLGGFLALRAAAYEKRLSAVVCFDVMEDFFACLLRFLPGARRRALAHLLTHGGARRPIARLVERQCDRSLMVRWGLAQGERVTGARDPYDFLRTALYYRTAPFSALVDQDVLLLAGRDDHYVPVDQLPRQLSTLTAARSVTARLFTAQESASNHCQLGNVGLALTTILRWLDGVAA